MATPALAVERAFSEHRPFLWSLLYRMCGDAADAEDLVQETFVRALQHPPARTDEPWRPWLVRVAMNLGRDLLRRRRRRRYEGPWLPSPAEDPPAEPSLGPGARYDRMESVSLAFLLALEALGPAQRAVLILRDVLDYSVRETAAALGLTPPNVKTTHLRARRKMAAYDRARRPPTSELRRQTRAALERFLLSLQSGDAAAVQSLLAEDVVSMADGGGEYAAARHPVAGRARVASLMVGLSSRMRPSEAEVRELNGLPALVARFDDVPPGWAPRATLQVELDEQGLIRRIYSVSATRKLCALS
jgi:RNA polymerase sigma-70 factor (ECF subfamily)